jgi:two-component system, OmpR family, phosphate regulon sensor histidine kinase PhoR
MYHKTLEQQISKFVGTLGQVPKELLPLLDAVSRTYDTADTERARADVTPDPVVQASVLKDLSNAKAAMVNLLEDLKEEKNQVEVKIVERTKELRDEHARFLASADSLPLGFAAVNEKNHLVISNPAMKRILGLDESEVEFDAINKVLSPFFSFKEDVHKCLVEHGESSVRDVDMGKKIIRCFISPITGGEKDIAIGVVILIEDVTDQRLLERSREEFFAIASHELRTPLTAIRGNMSMLEDFYADKIADPDVKQMIEDSITACARLIKIVNDFLDTSRLEQNRLKFEVKEFNALALADEVGKELKELAAKKKIVLSVTHPDGVMMVKADRDRSKQVLLNLVGNAINYTPQGEVKVHVELMNTYAKFIVTDSGVGISPQNQNFLFKKFQQAGESYLARDITQGTGLGLYISRLIITAMGGTIWLEKSAPNQGSTFGFTLPLSGEKK